MSDPFDALGFVPDEQPAKAEPSMLERVGQTAYDGAVGLGQGLSMDSADELAGAMPGTSIAEQQGIRDQARGRSPIAYDAMHAVGSAGPMLLSGGASALEQLGAMMMQGGVGGFMGADGGLQDRSGAGLVGAGTAPVVGAVAGGAAKGLGALEEWGGMLANKARAAAFSTPGKFSTLSREKGLDYTGDELAQEAERLGLTNKVIPQTAATYAKKAGAVKERAGQQHGAALAAGDAEGVFGDSGAIAQGLQGIEAAGLADRSSLGAPRARVATDLIDRLGPDQPMSPSELWALKKQYEKAGGFVSDEIKRLPEGQAPLINQDAAGFARQELGDTMEMASPETREAFDTAKRDYGFAATIENLAKERAIHNASHGMGMTHSLGLIGGGGLIAGPVGAMGAYASGQAARSYGQDAAANTMRGFEHLAGMGAGGAQTVARGAGQLTGQAASERERASNASKGHEMQNAVSRALQSDPSVLGQYAQQFQEAQQDPDPMVMSALISELNDDPQFRATVLPQLQRLSNPQGDY